MAVQTWNEAVHDVLAEAMAADPATCLFVADGFADRSGAEALAEAHGEDRVHVAPATPGSLIGIGAGAARAGVRAIVELHQDAAITQAIGHLAEHVAAARRGDAEHLPLLIRATVGHIDAPGDEISAASIPGLRVAVPSCPRDAVALTRAALQSPAAALLLEPLSMLHQSQEMPEHPETLDLGGAAVVQRGSDVSLIAVGAMVGIAIEAAELLRVEGLEAEVIDVRTVEPLDVETVIGSLQKTGRGLVADMAGSVGGWGAELCARLGAEAFDLLDAPLGRRSGRPQHSSAPTAQRLAQTVRELAAR